MQLLWPLPHSLTGVFQNLMLLKYAAGALAWYCPHEPFLIASMYWHALVLAGVSPKEIACSACTFGLDTQFTHLYAQFGCLACAANIHVSAQPVAPSAGITSPTGAPAALSVL